MTKLRSISILGWCILAIAVQAWAVDHVDLEIIPGPDSSSVGAGSVEGAESGVDSDLVAGRFDDASFFVDSPGQIRVIGPDGLSVPLTIDSSGIVTQESRIVSLRFCFPASEDAVSLPPGSYRIEWGPEIQATNRLSADFASELPFGGARREFRWPSRVPDEDSAAVEATEPDMPVSAPPAGKQADPFSLWYVLPTGIILAAMFMRKMKFRHA